MDRLNNKLIENKLLIVDLVFFVVIIIVLSSLFLNHTLADLEEIINRFNHQWKWSNHWYGLLFIYWVEIILLALAWDWIWFRLKSVVTTFYNELTHVCIKRKKLLIKLIRFKYGFDKLHYYMRFIFFFGRSGKNGSKLIDYIAGPTPSDLLKIVFSFVFGKPTILAGALTILTFNGSMIDKLQGITVKGVSFVWSNFTKLSSFAVLVVMIFLGYFVSREGIIRRSVALANRKKLEDIIELHRKLAHFVVAVILKGSRNLEYAIDCYDMLVDCWTYKRFPNAFETENRWYLWSFEESQHFMFEDIAEIEHLKIEIENMNSFDNKAISRWFLRYKYELLALSIKLLIMRTENLDRLLFTKKGFDEMMKVPNKYVSLTEIPEQIDTKKIEEERDFFRKNLLEDTIIEGLEVIFILYRYFVAVQNMLHIESDKLGRGLRIFTSKE